MQKPLLIAALLLAGLTACGGSDHDDRPPTMTPPAPPPVAGSAPDPYTASVASFAATTPEDIEPFGLDASPPSAPEDTEPGPVGP